MSEPVRPAFPISLVREALRKLRIRWPGGILGPREPEPSRDDDAERRRVQVAIIRRGLKEGGVSAGPIEGTHTPRDDADAHYLFRPGHALVRDGQDFDRLADWFREREKDFPGGFDPERDRGDTKVPGLVRVQLPRRADEEDEVLMTLAEIERDGVLEPGALTPEHIVYVTVSSGRYCPATEPEVPRSRHPWPPRASFDKEIPESKKVRVAVVDTGLWKAALDSPETPWLEGDDVFAGSEDLEQVNPSSIHEYAGHGTFVAGIISCVAPETRIDVEGALTQGGAVYEGDICDQIQDALTENNPQLVSISAGSHTRGGHPMLSFVLLAQNNELDENDDVLIVAAAGNDSSDERFWPAAFAEDHPWVVSVGSVDPDQKVSDFSNYGKHWVSVYARGRDLVNAFPKGTYTCTEPPHKGKVRKFDGLAQWSGTSFSTPLVAGLIAAEMRDNGLSARDAWRAVEATATTAHDARIGHDIRIVGPLT